MNADFIKIGWRKKKKNLHKQNTRIARISCDQKLQGPHAMFCNGAEKRQSAFQGAVE